MSRPVNLFFSYSHKDEALRDELAAHLALLRRQGVIRDWHARCVGAGDDWQGVVDEHLDRADVVLVLVSADFLASDYCYDVELRRVVERSARGEALLIPVILRACDWSGAPFGARRALPRDARPVTSWPNRDEAWNDVATSIRVAVAQLAQKPPAAEPPKAPSALPIAPAQWVAEPALASGSVVGPYVLREVLGSGGSGVAYRARHTTLGGWACVKILYPLGADPGPVGAAMARAVRGLRALDHPHIVRVHDFGAVELSGGKSFYLAMDLVRGKPLRTWSNDLAADPRASDERLRLACALASAMSAAHGCTYIDEIGFEQRGILHADLKPENILVREDGSPVILDFMIVDVQRFLDRSLLPTHHHRAPITADFGTPGYMAPEQESDGIVTVRSDIFSLGVTLAQLFTPDSGSGPKLFFGSHLPAGLSELFISMVDSSPERRPRDMASVASALSAVARRSALST